MHYIPSNHPITSHNFLACETTAPNLLLHLVTVVLCMAPRRISLAGVSILLLHSFTEPAFIKPHLSVGFIPVHSFPVTSPTREYNESWGHW